MARRAREGRELGRHQREVEGALEPEGRRPLDHPGVAGEAAGLLDPRAQVGPRARRQPAVDVVERAAGPHRGEGGGERATGRRVVVGVAGGHHLDARPQRQLDQRVVAGRVERVAVVPELDGDVAAPERVGQPGQLVGRGGGALLDQRTGHRPLAAPGEHQPVVAVARGGRRAGAGQGGEVGQRGARRALLAPELGLAAGARQQRVAPGVAGQHHQVGLAVEARARILEAPEVLEAAQVDVARARAGEAGRRRGVRFGHPGIGVAELGLGAPEGELGAEDGGQVQLAGRLGEADHAVEAVVIGERQRLEPEAGGLGHQLLGERGAVEEREVGVGVQLGVGHRAGGADGAGRRLVGRSLARPRRSVTAVGAHPGIAGTARARPIGEPALELGPGHGRVETAGIGHPAEGSEHLFDRPPVGLPAGDDRTSIT